MHPDETGQNGPEINFSCDGEIMHVNYRWPNEKPYSLNEAMNSNNKN